MVAKKTTRRTLTVLMNNILVGKLEKNSSGDLLFSYDPNWLALPDARPISLSLPLVPKPLSGNIIYNFFDNLLPDNPLIKSRIQTRFQTPTKQPFDLLASIGRDCVGAIQLVELNTTTYIPHTHQMSFHPIPEKEIASILRNTQTYPLGMPGTTDEFRISIAGAQEKTAFLRWNNQWNRPLQTTPTTHIFKLPIGYLPMQQMDLSDSCENEWLCTQIAKAFGLAVANCEIQYFDGVKALVVERFDRKYIAEGNYLIRLPQEDMCQALGVSPNLKYQSDGGPGIVDIMKCLLGSTTPIQDRDTFFKSQVLFWLLAAIDGHAKNFSIYIKARGEYQLTPLYDIMSAYPLIAKKQLHEKKIKMAMALKGKNNHYHWYQMQHRHFLEAATSANYSMERATHILNDMLKRVDDTITQVSEKLPATFPTDISQPIFKGMQLAKQRLLATC